MKFPLPAQFEKTAQRLVIVFTWFIIATGILLRMVVWCQNRNLFIDEANLARNFYERGFIDLAKPLSYEQYAPPVFLWIEKLISLVAGFSEQALRIYPLACGIASIFIFRRVLKFYIRDSMIWFPLALLCFSFLFVKYSSELKQYMPDAMITLLLLQIALTTDIFKTPARKFALIWVASGSIALWASMPAVFILTGIGCYYGWICYKEKQLKKLSPLVLACAAWLLQFGLYYITVLGPQANSDYLQHYHANYFLSALPHTAREWLHNRDRLKEILSNAGGFNDINTSVNLVLIIWAGLYLLIRRTKDFFLIALPIGLTLVAAAANKYSLIERVILFMQPLVVMLIGIGLYRLYSLRRFVFPVLACCYGVYTISVYNALNLFNHKLYFQEITAGLDFVNKHHGRGEQLFINDGATPPYIYYTSIHPDKAKWDQLLNAHLLKWNNNYGDISKQADTVYFIYEGAITKEELEHRRQEVRQELLPVASLDTSFVTVDMYIKKK